MTGLDLTVDDLIEVAVVITDYELEPVHPGFSIVIAPSEAGLANMGDFVRDMHAASGLLDDAQLTALDGSVAAFGTAVRAALAALEPFEPEGAVSREPAPEQSTAG